MMSVNIGMVGLEAEIAKAVASPTKFELAGRGDRLQRFDVVLVTHPLLGDLEILISDKSTTMNGFYGAVQFSIGLESFYRARPYIREFLGKPECEDWSMDQRLTWIVTDWLCVHARLERWMVETPTIVWVILAEMIDWMASDDFDVKELNTSKRRDVLKRAEVLMDQTVNASREVAEALHEDLLGVLTGLDPFWNVWRWFGINRGWWR